jgi:Flp pilus assembly pilin Flp
MTILLLGLQARLLLLVARRRDDGQATAEYALVLVGAAAIALLVVTWATKTNVVGKLLDLVFDQLTKKSKLS